MIQTILYALAISLLPQQTDQIYIDANLKFPHYYFQEENKTIYFSENTNAKLKPNNNALTLRQFKKGEQAQLIGTNPYTYWKIKYDNNIYYVSKENLTDYVYTGPKLTPSAGTIQGPSGKETYYNLDMSGVIAIMRNLGNNDPYWIREDGVKMLGDYVIIAASLDKHPKGSLIETSLGTGIVCDTGSFAHTNPNQIDIAVTW